MTKKAVVLRVVINYSGTEFFTKDENGYFKPHKTLESARDYIMRTYGCGTMIKVEISVRSFILGSKKITEGDIDGNIGSRHMESSVQ